MSELPIAVAKLLFYTVPSDRALAGWQPFDASWFDWDYLAKKDAEHIARILNGQQNSTTDNESTERTLRTN